MNFGETFTRPTTTPGTSPSSTSWSMRANVIVELVVAERDRGEVGVDAREMLGIDVDVELALLGVLVHGTR